MFSTQDVQSTLSALQNGQKLNINLQDILEDLFMVLNDKEKTVIVQRFGLDNTPRKTLEYIGKKFDITRERVRQIENVALNKLKRILPNTNLKIINTLAKQILSENGSIMLEDKIVSQVITSFQNTNEIDGYIVKLSLNIDNSLAKRDKSFDYHAFWYDSTLPFEWISFTLNSAVSLLKAKGDVLEESKLIEQVLKKAETRIPQISEEMVRSALEVDRRLKHTSNGWGLLDWRHINPKSIRDKAYIILKESGQPLHFIDIANRIVSHRFDKKMVTKQAVHNELIRYDQFVLVGRGLYALKEWGYQSGTVSDILENVLEKAGKPLTKQEIIQGVLKQRKVKIGTISLNLQNCPQFVRVGRAVYNLDKNKKKKQK